MLSRLHEFFALLRKNGVPVSPAEILDGLRAAELVGLGEPRNLHAALAATVVKRQVHRETFDDLFELFFLRRGDLGWKHADAPLLDALRESGFSEDEIEMLVAELSDEASRMSVTARLGMGLRRGPIEALLRLAGVRLDLSKLTNPLQIGFYTQQLMTQLRLRDAEGEIDQLRQRLAGRLGDERAAVLGEVIAAQMGQLRQSLRRHVTQEFERQNVNFLQKFRAETLADKPFSAMSDEELMRLGAEVARLGKKLREMTSLRPRTGRKGRFDARKTLRRSLRSGGIPFDLRRKRRRIDKPRLVVLCDISDSVRNVSRFMLQFAYTLQDHFSAVRSFVFVSDAAEITTLFREHEIRAAVEMAYRGAVVNVFANSNYGRAFTQFRERYLDAVTGKTTVIIIGDGRNNYNPPEDWVLADIRARARRVLWLNPEPAASWSFGDSAMHAYQPHCDRIAIVHNLKSLTEVVDSLVL